MNSQQNQILGLFDQVQLFQNINTHQPLKTKQYLSATSQDDKIKFNLQNSGRKFDIKKFQQNVLKQIISKNNQTIQHSSNRKSNNQSFSHAKSFKQITHQRKLSQSKSKSKKDLLLNQFKKEKQNLNKTHQNNAKILRHKLLNSLSNFDDYEMINIEDSIPILNQANILKILTSLQETKTKIQSRQLPEGRIKQEAKFIYFLWKMIDEQSITTRHLKEIIILLNELNKNQLTEALCTLYCRDGEIVTLFVDCWSKLKGDRFYYLKNSSKDKTLISNALNSSKLIQQKTQLPQKSVKKTYRSKTQYYDNNSDSPHCQQNFKNIKFLHPEQQKQLISRLYQDKKDIMTRRQKLKTIHYQQKQNQQLQKCTFKPLLTASLHKRSTSKSTQILLNKPNLQKKHLMQEQTETKLQKRYESRQRSQSKVKGFDKAVIRMKDGQSRSKLKQQQLAYYSVGQNYEKIKQKPMNPPRFLEREKEKKQETILFVIQFEIGRHKVKVKIHPTDTEISVSKKIAKIYGLKAEQEGEIREIVSMELNNYYKNIAEDVSEFIDN